MESNHHCILRGDMSYPLNDDPTLLLYHIFGEAGNLASNTRSAVNEFGA